MAKDKSTTAPAEGLDETTKVKKIKKDKGPKAEKTTVKASSAGDIGGPGSGGNFVAKDLIGEQLLITPTGLEEDIVTANGTSDAIRADIVVLNRKKVANSVVIDGGLIFQKVLQGQLRDALAKGTRVTGTLIQDEASKKAGQSAPYRLMAPSEDDITLAKAYLDTLNPLR